MTDEVGGEDLGQGECKEGLDDGDEGGDKEFNIRLGVGGFCEDIDGIERERYSDDDEGDETKFPTHEVT